MSYIGRDIRTGAFRQLDDISSGFDGSDTTHTMQVNSQKVTVGDVNQIILSLGGVIQKPGTDFTVSGSVLTFTTAPAANTSFFAVLLGSDNGGTVTPTDGSVTGDKLASTVTTSSNISLDGGTFVFNESGADKDFRIESDSNTHMLFVDAGNNVIGINESSPSSYYYNDLVVNSGDEGGITIVDTSSGQSALAFGDSTSGAARYAGRVLYNHNTETMQIGAGGNTQFNINSSGHMTNTSHCCVSVRKTSTQSNMTNNETITFDAEDRDQGNNFSSNIFTAPVDGSYLITVNVAVTGPDGTATYNRIKVNTTNYNYSFGIKAKQDYDVAQGDPSYDNYGGSIVTHMDAGDTAVVKWSVSGGSDKADAFDSTFASFTLLC